MEVLSQLGLTRNSCSKGILLLFVWLFICLRPASACNNVSPQDCIVENATKEIGVREVGGNNKGERVTTYLKAVNINTPSAWCAAFVAFILNSCDIKHTITAWSPTATAKNRIYDRRKPSENKTTPEGGDVFTLYYPSLKRIGHTGFITKWGDKWVETIEGNTSEADTRETSTGRDGVFRKKRLKSSIYQVSRWR